MPSYSLLPPPASPQTELTFFTTVNEALDAYYAALVAEQQAKTVRRRLPAGNQ